MDRRALLRGAALVAGGAVVGGGTRAALAESAVVPSYRDGRAVWPSPTSPVVSAAVHWRVDTDRRLVALTFDDGPDPRWTPTVLATLARFQAKATFFLVGERLARHRDLATAELMAGHEVGSHTWSHADLSRVAPAVVTDELRRTHDLITEMVGKPPTLLRPPYGHIDAVGLLAAATLGYSVALWSHHVRGTDSAHDLAETLDTVVPGSMVLVHDGGPQPTPALMQALPGLIGGLLAKGYALVTVSELLGAATPS